MKHAREENRAIGSSSSPKCCCCDDIFVHDQRSTMRENFIHPIREGLNIAKSTQKFAPRRDSQNIVYPRICTQEDTSIDIYGYDLIS